MSEQSLLMCTVSKLMTDLGVQNCWWQISQFVSPTTSSQTSYINNAEHEYLKNISLCCHQRSKIVTNIAEDSIDLKSKIDITLYWVGPSISIGWTTTYECVTLVFINVGQNGVFESWKMIATMSLPRCRFLSTLNQYFSRRKFIFSKIFIKNQFK